MKQRFDRVENRALAIALLVSLVLWNLPFGGVASYPFKLLATWLHELSHGVAMMATGAGFDSVVIYRDTSGLAYPKAGSGAFATAIIAGAGYMGTALWGALLFVVTPTARTARIALLVLASLLVLSAFLVVAIPDDGDAFGPYAIGVMGACIAAAALLLPDRWRVTFAHFIAAQSCVNALLDIRVLLRPNQVVNGVATGFSDSANMARATFSTTAEWATTFWAIAWLVWSLTVLYLAFRVSGSRELPSEAPDAVPTA